MTVNKLLSILLTMMLYAGTYALYRRDQSFTFENGSCWGGPTRVYSLHGSPVRNGLAILFWPCVRTENWARVAFYH